jgi:nitrogen regulatory protein PII
MQIEIKKDQYNQSEAKILDDNGKEILIPLTSMQIIVKPEGIVCEATIACIEKVNATTGDIDFYVPNVGQISSIVTKEGKKVSLCGIKPLKNINN